MSKRRDTARTAIQSQLKSLIAQLQLYKEDFSKTPEDRERLQELVDEAEALEKRYIELLEPKNELDREMPHLPGALFGATRLSRAG